VTFYDDAELAAVACLRAAAAELDSTEARSREIAAPMLRLYEQHGSHGVNALVVAQSRWLAITFHALAAQRGKTLDEYIDEWEMAKLEQHVSDADEEDDEGL
jgi:hypothetical protein